MKQPQSPADVHIKYSHLTVYFTWFVVEMVETAVTQERYLVRNVAGVECRDSGYMWNSSGTLGRDRYFSYLLSFLFVAWHDLFKPCKFSSLFGILNKWITDV
jgi:hypothetical protein